MIKIIMMENLFDELKSHNSIERNFVRDSLIFSQGSPAKGIIYVVEGSVRLVRHTKAGHSVPIHTAGVGESVAEASLFSDKYHCDCIAIENCVVQLIDKTSILKSLKNDPDLNITFMRHLAEQTISYRRRIELLTIKGAKERVLAALTDGVPHNNILHLASHLGLTHEATYRALSDLTKVGLLAKTGRGKYEIVKL